MCAVWSLLEGGPVKLRRGEQARILVQQPNRGEQLSDPGQSSGLECLGSPIAHRRCHLRCTGTAHGKAQGFGPALHGNTENTARWLHLPRCLYLSLHPDAQGVASQLVQEDDVWARKCWKSVVSALNTCHWWHMFFCQNSSKLHYIKSFCTIPG